MRYWGVLNTPSGISNRHHPPRPLCQTEVGRFNETSSKLNLDYIFLRESTVYRWIKEAGVENPGNRKVMSYSAEFREDVIKFARSNTNFATMQHFMIPDSTLRWVSLCILDNASSVSIGSSSRRATFTSLNIPQWQHMTLWNSVWMSKKAVGNAPCNGRVVHGDFSYERSVLSLN